MKIAIYTTRYPGIGGIEKHVEILEKALKKNGHEVCVISADKIYQLLRSQVAAQIFGSILFQIKSFFSYNNFDVINIQSGPGGLLFYPAKSRKKKIFYTSHHTYYQQINYLGEFLKYPLLVIEKLIYKLGDKVITVSESTKKILIQKYGIQEKNIHTLYNPLLCQNYKKNTQKRIPNTVLFIGRFDKRKNPVFMVELMREMIKTSKKFKMFLIGSGGLEGKCKKLSHKYKLTKYIKFLGNLDNTEKEQYMLTCQYLVVPSVFEGQGIVYLEGVSAGMNVLCRNCDGLKDMCPPNNRFNNILDAVKLLKRFSLKQDTPKLDKFSYKNYLEKLKSIFII